MAPSVQPVNEALLGELKESATQAGLQLVREKQQLTAVEGAIREMRGRLVHFARENVEWERERKRQHELAVEELMVEQKRLRALAKSRLGNVGLNGGLLALPAPAAFAATTAPLAPTPAVDTTGWLTLLINLDRRADRLSAARALPWDGVAIERLVGVEGRELSWDDLVADGVVHEQAAEQAQWASDQNVPTICRGTGSFSPHLTLGAVGCALAHRRAW